MSDRFPLPVWPVSLCMNSQPFYAGRITDDTGETVILFLLYSLESFLLLLLFLLMVIVLRLYLV
jgi:hypothetical protein